MVVKVNIGGYDFGAASYSVVEAATPIAAGDSSGQVGTIDVTVPRPDPDAPMRPGARLLVDFGPDYFIEETIELRDDWRGFIPGTVRSVSRDDSSGDLVFNCVSRLDLINAYNINAKPYIGTLEGAFRYYASLAGVTSGLSVSGSVSGRRVVYPGWQGELWYHLKIMAAAQDCEIALVDGVITLRPIGTRKVIQGRDISRSSSRQFGTLAQAVEVYNYSTREITNELVYPTGNWGNQDTEVFNVNAREDAEYQLELSASVSSIQAPTMQTFVSASHRTSSVYTVVANDGLPVPPALWEKNGGRLTLKINDDTTSLTLTLRGASGIPVSDGTYATNFSIALASDATGNRYSTLRIVGTGVAVEKEAIRISTGVTPQQTGTDIGVTIDNPFITDLNTCYQTGLRAANDYSGAPVTVNGSVTMLNASSDEAVFGNVAGARVYDKRSNRWYRIRTGTTTPESIQFDAEDDLTFGDIDDAWEDASYGDVDGRFSGMTYRQVDVAGMYE